MNRKITALVLALSLPVLSFAQIKVKGTVRDSALQPLPGVAVLISGTLSGCETELDGSFELSVKDKNATLEFSCLGYESQTLRVGDKTVFDIILEESADFLEETVVIGYGSVRKKDLTGSVGSIKSESLQNRMLLSVDDALSGGVAGLMVTSASGKPGAASNMLVRGASSLTGSTAPLVVVDGFPLFEVNTSGGGIDSFDVGMSSLSMINTDDIASIEVLKDASATAIYGNRGANGVILITTKKGRESGGKIQYSNYFGVQDMNRRYQMMDFAQYASYQAAINTSNELFYDKANGQARQISGVQTKDWQDGIFRTGFIQNHSLSVQEATKRTNFLFSGSYLQNQSVLIETDWKKITGKASVDHYFTDKVRAGVDISYSRIIDTGVPTGGEGTDQQAGVIIEALTAIPFDLTDANTQALFRKAGLKQSAIDNVLANWHGNPVNIARDTQLQKYINRTMINTYAEADILSDLRLKITFGYDNYSLKDRQYYPTSTPRGWFYGGQGLITSNEASSWINENTLTWTPTFGKHRLNALLGVSEQGYTSFWDQQEGTQFDYEELGFNNMGMATVSKNYSSKGQTRYISFMGRANYSYDNRYIATFTARRDGTSSFVKNKWGNFFSGALAWNIDSEEFMKLQSLVSTLKLRISAGQVGNSNVPTTGSYSQLMNTFYSFGGNELIGQSPASIANEELSWESTTEENLGLELGLWDDKVKFTADIYNKITSDLLLEAPVVNIAGFEKAWQNIGKLSNRGIELSLNATLVQTRDFQWSVNANYSLNRTKILELGQNGAPIYLGVSCLSGQNAIILEEGGSVGDIYGYETIGVYGLNDFKADGYTPREGVAIETGAERPGSMKFKDRDGNGKITPDDRTVIGNTMPDYFGAFGTEINYRRFNIYAQFNYSVGADIYNANYNFLAKFNSNSYNQMAFYEKRWSPENLSSTQYVNMTNNQVCSAFVEDASFLRLKTLRLSYTLPGKIFPAASHIDFIRAYISADNLFVLTSYSGYDPEVFSKQGSTSSSSILTSGFDYGVFPRARTFTIGFNFNFR
ncbi:MAG: SusC/RagA family TonB-linked outer membrane protein [Candidatus Cryptobacteroides sp.]